MTVYQPARCKIWRFDFWFKGQRYGGRAPTEADAHKCEEAMRRELRLEMGGLIPHRLLKISGPSALETNDNGQTVVASSDGLKWHRSEAARLYRNLQELLREPASNTGACYFIGHPESGPVKIGYTTQVRHRLRSIQTSHATAVVLLALMRGSKKAESFLHNYFAELHEHGEWFRREGPLLAFIDLLRGDVGVGTQIETAEKPKEICEIFDDLLRAAGVEIPNESGS